GKEHSTTECTENHREPQNRFLSFHPLISMPSVVNSFSSVETIITSLGSKDADVISHTLALLDVWVCPYGSFDFN
ncbi:MAG: hypothetical protein LDL53_09030, partial [Candidatus Hydrogenedens sp.]|nr:hypothetical protein [Candidatus Hydrogenedens sp.]